MSNGEFYQEEVLPAIFSRLDSVFPEFGWKKTPMGWTATNRNFTKGAFGCAPERVICNQRGSGVPAGFMVHGENEGRLWTAYLNGGVKPEGERFFEIVEELCKRSGIDYDSNRHEAGNNPARELRNRRKSRLESARNQLASEVGRRALAYLGKRCGSVEGVLEHTELGCTEHGNGVIIPLRDAAGVLQSTTTRWLDGQEPKYDNEKHFDFAGKLGASNLHNCLRHGGGTLVLVEGILEPELLRPHGLHVASVGGAGEKLNVELWQKLLALGFEKIVLALDTDKAGLKGCNTALNTVRRIAPDANVFVASIESYRGCKDYGELLEQHGAGAVADSISTALFHLTDAGQHIVNRAGEHGYSSDAIRSACGAALGFLKQYNFPPHLVRTSFWSVFREQIPGFDDDMLEEVLAFTEKKLAAARLEQITRQALVDTQAVLQKEGPTAALADLKTRLPALEEALAGAKGVASHPSLREAFLQREEELKEHRGKVEELIGIPQRTLKELDEATCGLRGLILVPAPPNVGKTAFCLQLGLDAVRHNLDTGLFFASLEMKRKQMLDRMMCNLAGMSWRRYVFGSKRGNKHEPFWPHELDRLEAARNHLLRLIDRIEIYDSEMLAGMDALALKEKKQKFKKEAGVERLFTLIDYLQKWKVPDEISSRKSPGDLDAYRMSQMQDLCESETEPTLVISATRKGSSDVGGYWQNSLDEALGSGINTYAPDMVLMPRAIEDEALADYYNSHVLEDDRIKLGKSEKEFRKKLRPIRERAAKNAGVSYMTLNIAKGRDGVERVELPLTYNFRTSSFVSGWIWHDDILKDKHSGTEKQVQIDLPAVSGDAGEVSAEGVGDIHEVAEEKE